MDSTIDNLIGDVPVSEQLASALERMATKDHTHDYATRNEVEELERKINMLIDLVGDLSVSEQIYIALNNTRQTFFKEVI